jgi:hypothetical protein
MLVCPSHVLRWQTTCGMIIPEYRSAPVQLRTVPSSVLSVSTNAGNMRTKPRFEPGVSVCIKINILKLKRWTNFADVIVIPLFPSLCKHNKTQAMFGRSWHSLQRNEFSPLKRKAERMPDGRAGEDQQYPGFPQTTRFYSAINCRPNCI